MVKMKKLSTETLYVVSSQLDKNSQKLPQRSKSNLAAAAGLFDKAAVKPAP